MLTVVIPLNTTWQLLRAWLQLFLDDPKYGRRYSEIDARYFNSAFSIAADAGCLFAGFGVVG